MNKNNELTRSDIVIDRDMEIDCDIGQIVTAYVETWFDVDKKFGTNTADDDDVWLNLYAKFNVPEDTLRLEYVICKSDNHEYHDYTPTEAETQLIKTMMREKCEEVYCCTLEEFIAPDEVPGMEVSQ
ncbi:MAG: hypothetical protein PHD46_06110 [Eubacteriales bacterium]|nr:hypothetical protein [Eubacteriales bacterium]MDD4422591.1 hypothetical protein [Eubacteriales bacterium]